jgi:hypothetical protein
MKRTLIVIAASVLSTVALAGPSMSTKWSNTSFPLDRCKERAESALRDAGFKDTKVLNYSVYAERGAYSAMVRCATAKQMVFFVVAGPEVDLCSRYLDSIGDGY